MWSDDPSVGPTPFFIHVVEARDADGEPDFRFVQTCVGEEGITCEVSETTLVNLLLLARELSACADLALSWTDADLNGDVEYRDELEQSVRNHHWHQPCLGFGFRIDRVFPNHITLRFFSDPRATHRLATVTFNVDELGANAGFISGLARDEFQEGWGYDLQPSGLTTGWFDDPEGFELTSPVEDA